MTRRDAVYTHGHHESVLRSHAWRTAENSAGYLLPRVRAGQRLLDVGCGPGMITFDLARRVAPGQVLGIDPSTEVIAQARAATPPDVGNVAFAVGDVYALDADDAAFDIVHAHQVLQHLGDPVAALREMARVLNPGGTIAVRDSDYAAFAWAPEDERLTEWRRVYRAVARANRAEPDAGRYLHGWALAAGLHDIVVSSSTWTFAAADDVAWWSDTWAERCRLSSFAEQAKAYGLADDVTLEAMAEGFRAWATRPGATFIVVHGEVLATR